MMHWRSMMMFPRLHTLLLQSFPNLSGWRCGGTRTHTHTHESWFALRPARPRLVITLWSPADSRTGCPHPCGGALGWTLQTLYGRCAQSTAPHQNLVPPKNVPGPAGRPQAGCWGQTWGACLCCRGPRAHPQTLSTPQEACAWNGECPDLHPYPNAHRPHHPNRSGSAVKGGQERRGRVNEAASY